MKRLVEFELEEGSVYMEVDEPAAPARLRKAGGKISDEPDELDEPVKAGRFKKALEQVRPAAEMVVEAFREINSPAEVGLEFAIKFNTKIGSFLLASADSETSFKVSLKWTNGPLSQAIGAEDEAKEPG